MDERNRSEQNERDVIIGDRETTSGSIGTTRGSDVSDTRETAGSGNDTFLPDNRMDSLRDQWSDVQAGFIDDPRSAVERAQQLVDTLVKELTDVFARERSKLEGQWSSGGQVDTEALRVALQRYRDFFNRLLET
ncbi:MAG: hypothetical protein JO165_08025 [Candidatus Eremiobacteraeota bacterium]|nr:hypothetical protein [Candidatus Eremiobacteraeota bacterium]